MVFEQIEKLKHEYTDKYVVVDAERPELARFAKTVGRVKTVNMSGRALVEFQEMALNIGWFDIDIDYLKVVDKPKEKEKPAAKPAKAAAKKAPTAKETPAAKAAPTGDQKLSPLEMARMQGAAKKDGNGEKASSKLSVAEMLAAARTEKTSVAEQLAAARSKSKDGASSAAPATRSVAATEEAAPAGKADRAKMSVADMIAMAKGEKSGVAAAPASISSTRSVAATEEAVSVEATAEPEVVETPTPAPSAAPAGKVDRASMSVDDMIAWCREHDAGS